MRTADIPRLILLFRSRLRYDRCHVGYCGKWTGHSVFTIRVSHHLVFHFSSSIQQLGHSVGAILIINVMHNVSVPRYPVLQMK